MFKFMEFTFLENTLIRGVFTHAPPDSKLDPNSCHHALGRRKLLISPGRQNSLENLFPPTAERGGRNYDLLYQNSVGKYKDDLEH